MQRTENLATPHVRFDLLDILHTVLKRRRFILLVTALAFLIGLAVYFLGAPNYEAKAEVMVSNPVYSDRARIFSQGTFVDYFANEQINDRALAIATSDGVAREIVRQNDLMKAYRIKADKPGAMETALKRLEGNLKIGRTEYGSLNISFADKDPQRAAQVANSAVALIETAFNRYLSGIRTQSRNAVRARIAQSDSAIRVLTDSLVALRERTGIYDIISPNRYGLTLGNMRSTNARAIEELQNLESVKDQYVIDRSRYVGMDAEGSIGLNDKELPALQVISPAEVPGKKSGLGLVPTLVAFTLAGLAFSTLWVVFSGWYRRMAVAIQSREEI